MRMALASHQLSGTFPDTFGPPAAQEAPVIQEELQQVQIGPAQLPALGEVVAQPGIEIFDK